MQPISSFTVLLKLLMIARLYIFFSMFIFNWLPFNLFHQFIFISSTGTSLIYKLSPCLSYTVLEHLWPVYGLAIKFILEFIYNQYYEAYSFQKCIKYLILPKQSISLQSTEKQLSGWEHCNIWVFSLWKYKLHWW